MLFSMGMVARSQWSELALHLAFELLSNGIAILIYVYCSQAPSEDSVSINTPGRIDRGKLGRGWCLQLVLGCCIVVS